MTSPRCTICASPDCRQFDHTVETPFRLRPTTPPDDEPEVPAPPRRARRRGETTIRPTENHAREIEDR